MNVNIYYGVDMKSIKDKVYYLSVRGTDMKCTVYDYYFLCYLVYGLSNIDWIDTADIKIEYVEYDRKKHEHGYCDPEECYNYFIEEIRYM